MPLPSPRIIAVIVFVIMVVLMITLGPAACNKFRSMGLQHRVDQGQMQAIGNSAIDAVQTQGQVTSNASASEDLTMNNAKEIDAAKGSDQRVTDDAQLAGLKAICRRPSNRTRQRCIDLLAKP